MALNIIVGLNDGGAESVLYRLCASDNPQCHHVVSLMGPGKYGPLLEEAGVRVTCLNMPEGRVTLSGLWHLYLLLKRQKPAAVQTWMYHADLLGGVLARLAGIKNVFWNIRHSELEPGKSKRSTIWVAKTCALLSRWIPRKIVCCAERAKQVHISYGYYSNKMVVINNGYNLDKYKPDPESGVKVRTELNLSQTELFFGMIGRFNVQKDHHGLLRSLGFLKEKGIKFKCALVGSNMTTDNKKLVTWIKQRDLVEEIILLGQRTDIASLMNAFDIHLFSSSFGEGFPNVLAEAMACGTPCLTTDVGDASQIVGETGWVVPAMESKAFATALCVAIEELRDDPEEWQRRSEAAVGRVTREFNLDKMIQAYYSVWNFKP